MYDPKVGRFISADPIGFEAADPNLYRYVGNSVIRYVDPLGLDDACVEPPHAKERLEGITMAYMLSSRDWTSNGTWKIKVDWRENDSRDAGHLGGARTPVFWLTYQPTDAVRQFVGRSLWRGGPQPRLILVHAVDPDWATARFDGQFTAWGGDVDDPFYYPLPQYAKGIASLLEDGGRTLIDAPNRNSRMTTCAVLEVPNECDTKARRQYMLGCVSYERVYTSDLGDRHVVVSGDILKAGDTKNNIASVEPGDMFWECTKRNGRNGPQESELPEW